MQVKALSGMLSNTTAVVKTRHESIILFALHLLRRGLSILTLTVLQMLTAPYFSDDRQHKMI